MLIDSSAVINLPHDGEIRVKKRQNAEEIKPVETSGRGDEPELDISRDKITEKNTDTRHLDTGTIYNKYGEVDSDGDEKSDIKPKNIDVIV